MNIDQYFTRFFMAPDGVEGGSVDTGPDTDLLTMAPPDISGLSFTGDAEPTVVIPVASEKLPEKAREPEQKVVEKPLKGEPPAAQLRKELDATKAELRLLKEQHEKGDPRITEAQAAVKAKEEALRAREEEVKGLNDKLSDYEKRLQMASPAIQAKIDELNQGYNDDAHKFWGRVPELDQTGFNSLLVDYAKLPFGKPEYREARAAWEAAVNDKLGGSEDREHRKLEATIGFIEKTKDFIDEREKKVRGIERDVRKFQLDSDKELYTRAKTRISSLLEKARTIPEGMAATSPQHPRVAIAQFEKVLGDKAADLSKGIEPFIERVMAGMAPRGDEDYTGMTPQQIQDSRAEEAALLERSRDEAVEIMYNGAKALRLMPALVKELRRLQAKTKDESEAAPPDPTRPAAGTPSDDDEIASFRPPSLEGLNF